jgi:CMP-N-acetylneuraminic acid synthetase
MKYVGNYGEYRVLACLLERDVEVYQAIKTNQPDFDLTAILTSDKVVRIQVKATVLNNKSTNNAIDRIDKEYDFLVVVIVAEDKTARFFVMSKTEAIAAKGENAQFGTTQQKKKLFQVKDVLLPYENNWEKILNA